MNLFARALRLPRRRVAELRTGELLGRITVDSDAVENLLLRSAFPKLAALVALIAAAALFSLLSAALTITVLVGLLFTAAVLIGLAHHQAGRPARGLVAARAQLRHTLIETLDGLPELRSFGAEPRAVASVTGHLEQFARNRQQLTSLAARAQSAGTLLADLTLLVVVATAAGLTGAGQLSAPEFVAVCLVAIAVFEPVIALPAAVTAHAKARAAATRLSELLPADGAPGDGSPAAADPFVALQIKFEREHLQLALDAGDTVLLTGPSGSVKSTILRAITAQGAPGTQVRIGNADAAKLDPEALGRVTLIAQDAYVFDGTIRENLLLAAPSAGEGELQRVLAAAALDDTVAGFPAGLDTRVGPGGQALSGGQRRRLSVAQGLLQRPNTLLLDEPTEGLDSATASRLLAGVREFDPDAAIVIALHDRQALDLPWMPTAHIELAPAP